MRQKKIISMGSSMLSCILLTDCVTLAPWWRVLHHSTEYLMMGKLIRPITLKTEAILSFCIKISS